MKKVCYVLTIPGTVKSFFVEQLKYLADHKMDVTVICSKDSTLQGELGDRVKYIACEIPRGVSFLGTVKSTVKLIKILKKEKYDLVQYSTPNAAFNAAIASKVCGVKIRNYHLMGLRYEGEKGIKRVILKLIEKVACALSTNIECVSNSLMEECLKNKLFRKNKAVVVWNGSTGGVNIGRFDYNKREQWRIDVRKELGISLNDFLFGFVGRITRDKGINEILMAFRELQLEAKLLLLGSPEGIDTIEPSLWMEAQENPNIYIYESVLDVERYYAAIDVLLLPSYREGFGNVVIEAAAVGTPAIVSNISGPIDAIIEQKTAITVEVRNVSDLISKMRAISNSDYIQMGMDAATYSRNTFDSTKLNEKILERKNMLLGH